MGENKYCDTNMCYLCERNGITPEELRMSLDMSKLQFYNYGSRAVNTISKYFNISINEFVYEDLRIPSQFRYLSIKEEKYKFITSLCDTLNQDILKWKSTSKELIYKLYGTGVYKQISFQIEKDEYTFVVILNLTYDSEPEKGCILFPKGCYAYGYIKFDKDYNRYFKSFEDSKFKNLCDLLLQVKDISLEKWNTEEKYRHETKTVLSGEMDNNFHIEQITKRVESAFNYITYFGVVGLECLEDKEQLMILNNALKYITQIKQYGCVDKDILVDISKVEKNFLKYLKVKPSGKCSCLAEELNEVEVNLKNMAEDIKYKIFVEEKEQKRINKENKIKDALFQEMKIAKSYLGRWPIEDMKEFTKYMSTITIDELFEQLHWIHFMFIDDDDNKYCELSDDEKHVLSNFIWAKRMYTFRFIDDKELCDYRLDFGYDNRDGVCMLLRFINAYKNKDIEKNYEYLMSIYSEILIYLFILQPEKFNEIRILKEYNINKKTSIKIVYGNTCFISHISNDMKSIKKEKFVNCKVIYELSQAQWTDFFENTDDKVMYKASSDVFNVVSELFIVHGSAFDRFFNGRKCVKKVKWFTDGERSGLDKFSKMIDFDWGGKVLERQGYKYFVNNGELFVEGIFDTIELLDNNKNYRLFPLVDQYLATMIWKYMENYLRILTKYNSECNYEYGGYYCMEVFLNNEDVPKEIKQDYSIMKQLIESNKIRDAVYLGMDNYFEKNLEERKWWKNILNK